MLFPPGLSRRLFNRVRTACDTRPRATRRSDMEGTAQVNGVDLWYEVSGEGEPVVQIHGAGFGHFNFAPATPELAKRFRVVDFDMRGYGRPDRPVQHYGMGVWADDVGGLLHALDIPEAHAHGTAMGGRIATRLPGNST